MSHTIRSSKYLTYRTGLARGQFWFLADLLREHIMQNGGRLWRLGVQRASDPGNRCVPSVEQALLLYMARIRTGWTQEDLEIGYGVDQTTISRYLEDVGGMLAEILPTGRNVAKELKNMKSIKGLTVLIPGFDGTIIVDGTHSRIQRPSDSDARKAAYGGRKKAFTLDTAVFVTTDGGIMGDKRHRAGGHPRHNGASRGPLPQLEVIGTGMLDPGTPPDEKLGLLGDSGYQGAAKDCPGTNVGIPIKKPKGGELTPEKEYDKRLSRRRMVVGHVIGYLKEYSILAGVFV